MTDQLDTDTAQDDHVDQDADQVDTDQTDQTDQADQQDDVEGFNEKQLQQMYSASGRIISKQFEEKILPMLQELKPQTPQTQTPSAGEDFNKSLQDMIFSGDVVGAFERYSTAKAQQETNLTQAQETATNKAITTYSEDPLYKEIYDDVKERANKLVKDGFPPIPAARTAMAEVKAGYLERKLTGDPEGSLGMLGGGIRTKTTKAVKLPPEFKAACAKGIKDGLWKDEKEYIADLSPRVKAKLGI